MWVCRPEGSERKGPLHVRNPRGHNRSGQSWYPKLPSWHIGADVRWGKEGEECESRHYQLMGSQVAGLMVTVSGLGYLCSDQAIGGCHLLSERQVLLGNLRGRPTAAES
jgi:hypothetical protein